MSSVLLQFRCYLFTKKQFLCVILLSVLLCSRPQLRAYHPVSFNFLVTHAHVKQTLDWFPAPLYLRTVRLYKCFIVIIIIIIIIINSIPSVVKIPRVKSKAKSKRNAGTTRSRPQWLCGRKCPEWQLRCIVELPLTGVGIGRRYYCLLYTSPSPRD